jgi:hypothetical protein
MVTFAFTTLIHESASIVTLLDIVQPRSAPDLGWKRIRDSGFGQAHISG